MASSTIRCPECGWSAERGSTVDGFCSVCLLSLGLTPPEPAAEAEPSPKRAGESPGARAEARRRRLSPLDAGVVGPAWAMPAKLMRQASRRLQVAAFGVGLSFAVAIAVNSAIATLDWYTYSHFAIKNLLAGFIVAVSLALAWLARSGRLTPATLLRLSLGYEVVVAFFISMGDHLEPLPDGVPLANLSWLCIWIVMFPLMVPASPRWALLASLASASTWPLAYFVGRALGGPPVPPHLLILDSLVNYIAVGIAMFSTIVIGRLQELGCYELVEKLDHGGMGEIWRAHHRMLARPVAIKLIRPELLGAKSPLEASALVGRFQREAEATAGLHSAHTVALHDFGVTREGAFYYVMDLLEGLDLETLVRRFGPVPPERAIHLLIQACDSLAEAHAVGLVHRDVKPANMIACRWGLKWDFLKVLDFGLVRTTGVSSGDVHLTTEGVVSGTPAYMAPETALGRQALDSRVDLYGLGCVGYWLLTGERVFAGRTSDELLLHHIKTAPVPPSQRVATPIPADLEALVLSCLAKDSGDRPESAEWLAARLLECTTAERWTPVRAQAWWERNGGGDTRI